MKTTLKSLIMLIITMIATTISETGFPQGAEWYILGISVVGTALIHIAQSFAIPTNSVPGDLNWRDMLKGAIVALGNFLAQYGASQIPDVVINWQQMVQSAAMVFVMYILKQIATNPAAKQLK